MGNFFSKLKALWDQGLRGRGSKMIKYERWQEKLTGQTAKLCSIGLVTYTARTNPENTVQFRNKRTKEEDKGYEITRPVVTTTVRRNPNERTKEEDKGYEITRPVVTTTVRRNPNERTKREDKGYEITRSVVTTTVRRNPKRKKTKRLNILERL